MATKITIEALSPASLCRQIADMPHETRAVVTATENGKPWAVLDISPLTDTKRSAFPLAAGGWIGDTRKRSESGVMFGAGQDGAHALSLVVNRAAKMFTKYGA